MTADTPGGAPTGPFGRALAAICRAVAAFGGILLSAAGVLTVVSVMGRYLFNLPVPGDFELVEIASGVAVFCFLPYCQMVRGNVIVDVFTAGAPPRVRAGLDVIGAVALGAIAVLLVWRMTEGGIELRNIGEQTILLEIPRYLVFYPAVLCLVLLVLVSAYTGWLSLRTATRGNANGATP